jgi:histidine triad (HIT) family protein
MTNKVEPDCPFCSVVRGESPVSIVHETESVLAMMDIQPVNPGHVMVIPKGHASYLGDLAPEIGSEVFRVGMNVAAGLRRNAVRCEGVNFFVADGEAAGQEIIHVHLHVFPRFKGDGFGLSFSPSYGTRPPRVELDQVAAKIKAAMPKCV